MTSVHIFSSVYQFVAAFVGFVPVTVPAFERIRFGGF
jgi:hypothetical protein